MASDWVFDSLVGFLKGPVWNVPILTFIENKSLTFEADADFEGVAEDYQQIHEEYKNLVDFMLGSYMEDIGITPEQFEAACGKASANIKSKFHQTLFEQVWAADDFEIFKRMMIQKNLQLQLQALELLQHRYGLKPDGLFAGDAALPPDENAILEQVLKTSLEEHAALQSELNTETRELEEALAASSAETTQLQSMRRQEQRLLQRALQRPEEEETDGVAEQRASRTPSAPAEDISAEDVARRKAYLRDQRDKLLALKQQERLKQLRAYESSEQEGGRPKSSYAATRAMSGAPLDPQTLQVRRALAARLKEEVIDG